MVTYGFGRTILKTFVMDDWLQKGTPLIGTTADSLRVKIGNPLFLSLCSLSGSKTTLVLSRMSLENMSKPKVALLLKNSLKNRFTLIGIISWPSSYSCSASFRGKLLRSAFNLSSVGISSSLKEGATCLTSS